MFLESLASRKLHHLGLHIARLSSPQMIQRKERNCGMICEWWGETYWDIRKVLQHPPHQKITDIKKINALAPQSESSTSIYVQYIIYSRQYTNHIIWFDIHLWTLLSIYNYESPHITTKPFYTFRVPVAAGFFSHRSLLSLQSPFHSPVFRWRTG